MWVKVPVKKSYLIPAAFKNGFVYHHAEGDYAMLFQWLPEKTECKVPVYATHHIGVSGINNCGKIFYFKFYCRWCCRIGH